MGKNGAALRHEKEVRRASAWDREHDRHQKQVDRAIAALSPEELEAFPSTLDAACREMAKCMPAEEVDDFREFARDQFALAIFSRRIKGRS